MVTVEKQAQGERVQDVMPQRESSYTQEFSNVEFVMPCAPTSWFTGKTWEFNGRDARLDSEGVVLGRERFS